MKRLLALVLSLALMLGVCALTLASCGEDDTPATVPVETLESLDGKTSEEIFEEIAADIGAFTNYTLELTTSGGGADQKDIQKHDGNNQHHVTTIYGETYLEYWWIDGWYYMGESPYSYSSYYKMQMTWEYYLENYLKTDETGTFLNYPLSWFEDLSIKKQGNSYYLEAVINGDKINEYFDRNGAMSGIEVSNVSVQINIDATGTFKSITLKYTQTQAQGSFNFTSTGTFKDIGTTVVEGPENPDDFTDRSSAI